MRLDPKQLGFEMIKLKEFLERGLVGQPEAIDTVLNIYSLNQAGLNSPGRPIGSFLFLGPTGTGKTKTVEVLADALLGNPKNMIKIDCAEFQHSHEIAKLIGSPPGYLGHRETHPLLSQEVLNQHFTDKIQISLVLFDEIEKASDALWNLLLGILDKGVLTLGDNRKVNFSRAMIFLTSNLGASEMDKMLNPRMGFGLAQGTSSDSGSGGVNEGVKRSAIEASRKKFTPEFMNRLDKIVVFHPLGVEDIGRILDLELGEVQNRVMNRNINQMFAVSLSVDAKNFLVKKGFDPRYGARNLKREIERSLVLPLANLISSGQVGFGDVVSVYAGGEGELLFKRSREGLNLSDITHEIRSLYPKYNFRLEPIVFATRRS